MSLGNPNESMHNGRMIQRVEGLRPPKYLIASSGHAMAHLPAIGLLAEASLSGSTIVGRKMANSKTGRVLFYEW